MKAQITQIKFGFLEIQGLMFPDGSFGVSIPQVNELISFSASNNTTSRDLKRLLGDGFSPTKTKVEGLRQLINTMSLIEFEKMLRLLDRAGNLQARQLVDSLVGLSLTQLFADAFGQQFEANDRQAYLKNRMEGIQARNTFTDAIRDQYLESHPDAEKVPFYAYSNPSDALNRLLTGHPASYWREKLGVETDEQLRASWGNKQLGRIKTVEELAKVKVRFEGKSPVDAIKAAVETFHYEVWSEDDLLGKGDPQTYFRNHKRRSRGSKKPG